jgi:hypothetical protein
LGFDKYISESKQAAGATWQHCLSAFRAGSGEALEELVVEPVIV